MFQVCPCAPTHSNDPQHFEMILSKSSDHHNVSLGCSVTELLCVKVVVEESLETQDFIDDFFLNNHLDNIQWIYCNVKIV